MLKKLKQAGIKTVINLGQYGDLYKEKMEKAGFKYVDYDIYHYFTGGILGGQTNIPEKKEKLIEYIKTMQDEYCYIGCEFGTYRTDAAVFLNNLFNPKVKRNCKIYSPEMVGFVTVFANLIYKNMTPEDKKAIGWTPEFEEEFKQKIAINLQY